MTEYQDDSLFEISYKEKLIKTRYAPELSFSQLEMDHCIELSLVVSGKGVHRVLSQVLECQTGDIYIIDKGIPHGYFTSNESDSLKVLSLSFDASDCLSGEYSDSSLRNFCYGIFRDKSPVSYAMLSSRALIEVKNHLEFIKNELSLKKSFWQDSVKSNLILLLITLSRYINLAETQLTIKTKDWSTVSVAIREIQNRCSDSNMTLESIANSLYISKSRLSRLLQKEIGESFLDYVRKVRINRACALLKDTNLTNEEIVRSCGLKDVPSFYRVFKSEMGQTPNQYRVSHSDVVQTNNHSPSYSILDDICDNMKFGKTQNITKLVKQAINDGIPPAQILNNGLLAGMNIVGSKFKANEMYVPEVLLVARSINKSIEILKSEFSDNISVTKGRVCLGTVRGDLHDIGKNLVKMMMEINGIEVIDLGTDVSPETYVKTAIEKECSIICCSCLLTTTMNIIKDVVELANNEGIHDKVKIMIGGAPITEHFCKESGADIYTENAIEAAEAAIKYCQPIINTEEDLK